jgi:quinol monooxygenase YgiN
VNRFRERRWNDQPVPGDRWGFSMGVTAVVQHHVADYEVWRKAYDGFGDVQKAGGVTRQSVYRSIDDPNNVLIMHGFASMADAEKFLAGAELRDAMQQAGVQGQPRVEIYQDA